MIYKGDWVQGKKHGHGADFKITGEKIYEGAFADKQREGLGVLYAENGTTERYKGQFSAGLPDGEGVYYHSNG
jgi:hypothetical protein